MHTIPQPHVLFRFVTIQYRSITTLLAVSLLSGFALWTIGWNTKVKAASPVMAASGFVYILNECNQCDNRIFGFALDETTGALTPLTNGFPVATGGNGAFSFTSELLTIDRNNLRLFAINAASNTVSAFKIDPVTGGLTAMFSSPVNLNDAVTGGIWTTIAVYPSCFDSLLVVGDQGNNSDNTGHLASFKITETTKTLVSTLNTAKAHPLSIAFSRNGKFVYTGGGFGNHFAGFRIDPTGALSSLTAAVSFNSGNENPAAYATDDQGRLFMANRPHHELRVFTTDKDTGVPTFVSILTPNGLDHAAQGVLAPNQQFYLVSDKLTNDQLVVGVYKINDANNSLGAITGSPFSSEGKDVREVNLLAFSGDGKYLVTAHGQTRNLTIYEVDASGALAIKGTQPLNTLGATGVLNGIAYLPPANGPGKTTTTVTIDAPAITFGENGKVIVTVTTEPPGITLSGNVSLSVDGGPPTTRPLSPDGTVEFTTSLLTAGSHSLVANFLPEQDCFAANSQTGTLLVNEAGTTTTINAPPIRFGQDGTVTVTVRRNPVGVTPSGDVLLKVNGGAPRTRPLSGGSTTFIIKKPSLGIHTLRADFPAQGGFKASSSPLTKLVVAPPLQTITQINAPAVTPRLPPVQTIPVTVRVTTSSFPFANASGSVSLSVDNRAAVKLPLAAGSAIFHIVVSKVAFHSLRARFPTQAGFNASGAKVIFLVRRAPDPITTRTR